MVVVGAKGLAKELLEIFAQNDDLGNLWFFDNVSPEFTGLLLDRFRVLRTLPQVQEVFDRTGDTSFCLGLGSPLFRQRLASEFSKIGGKLTSVISRNADIGIFGTNLDAGCCVLSGAVITASVTIGEGSLINPNVTISHDSTLGKFVEVSPGANITGNCSIGDYSFIGSNAVILPKVRVGKNVTVGAGAVVTKDIPDNCVVAGVPAVIRRHVPPIEF